MVLTVICVCMCVSMLLSFLAAHEFPGPRLKLLFFLLVSLAGSFLFLALCGVLSALLADQRQQILTSMRQEFWSAIGGVVAMAYVGMWRLPRIIARQIERRRD